MYASKAITSLQYCKSTQVPTDADRQCRSFWRPTLSVGNYDVGLCVRGADNVVAHLGPVHFLSPDKKPRIHCLVICGSQLLTLNNLGGIWRHISLSDIRSVISLY